MIVLTTPSYNQPQLLIAALIQSVYISKGEESRRGIKIGAIEKQRVILILVSNLIDYEFLWRRLDG
ncbi:hypothetical protein C5472_03125 [Photorhabdus sp. RW14-46]|nr:hypothetical protein A4R40_02870 [Photorhabdus laumondii subsp. laumondii]NHB60181.1 hypothetical protein [Photorhabdus sp. RW14-46]PQQ39016.1 hypothetical protein C6H68_04430 [Photorhabdus luminescens]RAW73346.1 hypothetical protein CKY15_05385 [Photorhabdus sp. S7-51]RAW75038.1 hypothetical protein CKY14_04195 [Photorhabdus sp. S14-60]RAW79268.1 hypothetical protein CKY06_04345 [Photorhabdus sp. S15-56]RAW84078.1 hypothetical protein CKY12_13535 [Photorhabdus sp. S12-55]RAW84165.1 hypot